MVDFSKIFNIVFVAVCCALLLFLLISAIVVAAKGKRKCNAFDVIVRVLSSLVLVASAVMVTCAVLSMSDANDSFCIIVGEGEVSGAWLVISGDITELPVPQLFTALSTVIGFGLSAVLLIVSLTALIVDCLVANKKADKKSDKQAAAAKKTPEQLKREAELERIKRIGESAVRKTSSVAASDKSENAEQENKSAADKSAAPSDDAQDFDWRTQSEQNNQPEFVGITDRPSDFDSFDSFDDDGEAEPDTQVDDADRAEPETEQADTSFDDDEPSDDTKEQVYYDADEQFSFDGVAEDEVVTNDEAVDEIYDRSVDQANDDAAYDRAHDGADEDTDIQYEPDGDTDGVDDIDEEIDSTDYEQDTGDEQQSLQTEQPIEHSRPIDDVEPDASYDGIDESDIEPDRGIYIPEIRTVTRHENEPKPEQAVKPAKAKPAMTKAAAKPKKPSSPKPKKAGGGTASNPIPPEKKLPVTRRYVILDRHNAVNMFGEYLKERNQADKDKLKSSINTIIIE